MTWKRWPFGKKKQNKLEKSLERIANSLEVSLSRTADVIEDYHNMQKKLIENPAAFVQASVEAANEAAPQLATGGVIRGQLGDGCDGAIVNGNGEIIDQSQMTDEERQDIVLKAVKMLETQMDDMKKHVTDAIGELSDKQLKRVQHNIDSGYQPNLRRRTGCMYMDFGVGDEQFHLKL